MALLALAAAGWTAGCAGDCKQSSDIQVTIIAGPGVDVSRIDRLRIILVIDDKAPKTTDFKPDQPLVASGSTLLLRPDPAPSDHYQVSVTINAMDAEGTLLAIGSDAQSVSTSGCNRLTTHLAGLPGVTSPDGGGDTDMGPGIDLAGCFGGLPDEDDDGRANRCDVCAAEPENTGPVDGDGDGVPNACDPDPTAAGNQMVYFEPFDSDAGHWTETTQGAFVDSGYLILDSGPDPTVSLSSRNTTDLLPANVRAETWVWLVQLTMGADVSTGIFLGPTPAPADASGVLCSTTFHANASDTVEVSPVSDGVIQSASAKVANLGVAFPFTRLVRLRLTQRGNSYVCELGVLNVQTKTVTTLAVTPTLSVNAPTGNQFMILRSVNAQAHFHSVVAETTMP